jgi:lipopolysaccharide assembly protein A
VTTSSDGASVSEDAPVRRGRRISPRLVITLVVIALIAIFIAQNRDEVRVQLFALTLTSPLWLILVVMIAVGGLGGFLTHRRR